MFGHCIQIHILVKDTTFGNGHFDNMHFGNRAF